MTNCKYKLRKLSVGLVSVGTMLIAPTVLGQEVSTTGSTETSAASTASVDATTSGTTASGASGESSDASVASSEGSQGSESAPASPQPQPQAQTAPAATSASSKAKTEEQTPKAATSSTPSTPAASSSSNSNQGASTETEPQMMEVEQYKVDKEETELKVKDGNQPKNERSVSQNKNTKLIRNRDGEQRDIVDIKREVKDNGDGTLDVTLKVTPKEIDKGADVMALLDVSKKMTDADFDNAKEKIKKLVTTLTSKSNSDEHKHNSRNSVRLMTFYREISDPIDISGKTDAELDQLLNELREKAKANYDWGVDLQGAIHKAREIFNKGQKSKKRQHIVLFSQGESTFSYDIKNKNDSTVTKTRITEKVTTSNPLLPWPPIFDHTHQNADMLKDVEHLISLAQKLGMTELSSIRTILQGVGTASQIGGLFLGGGSLTEYLTLQEYKTDTFTKEQFDYTKRVGEGYYYHSFSDRKSENTMPLENEIRTALKPYLPKFEKGNWFTNVLNYFELKEKAEQAKLDVIMKVIKSVFYKRQYHYYNHNLSAIAEAKMAQQEGITFYSVDVTASNTARRVKRQTAVLKNTKEEERNKKFDDYLKKMSEGNDFLKDKDIESKDKFKDTLTELTIKDEFEDKVTVETNSEGKKNYKTNLNENTLEVNHTPSKAGSWLLSATKESLTWTISKEQLKQAFEDGTSLTLTYKLKVKDDKFKTALDSKKKRTKRDTPTENENSVTEKIISNTVNYKINKQEVKGNKLDEVSLTYSKLKVPVPQIDGHVIEPQAPKLPELPPVIERGPVLDYKEESIYRLPLEHGSNAPDTQVTIEEDTVPQRPDILVGGQSGPVDITEDTQPGMSGSNDATVVEEDTVPKRPDVLVGGQSDPIDITEDTQPSVSGSNDATVVEEDTAPKRPDILVGGQSDPIDITEDTQPGMSGSNDATVIEEDTKPKRFFHFDNEPQAPEKPKEQPSLSLPQAPVYKAAHHLPASGDKREASFTIVALTIIGAAGLLSKKRRDTEEN
ncbi:serum opacification factor [Streptococcus pyogenes]|uniref:serum opacification factor n=1 Tax=Streptococcus pyogenes TaxID=1314 RepID=UPI002B5A887F|nr:fibronectin binding protein [Streptococcus pyogenes]